MKNLVVIFGGKSTEHDISILSAMQVMENLDKTKYNILPVYISKNGKWFFGDSLHKLETFKSLNLKKYKKVSILPNSNYLYVNKLGFYKKFIQIDCAMLVLHGMNGEDGSIQGLLELSNIPYTSCGVMASSIGMSKYMQKLVFAGLDIPVLPYFQLTKSEYAKIDNKFKIEKIMFPLIVKPDKLGSSIGISFCKNLTQLKRALNLAFKFDDIVVIEKAVVNMQEINISIIGTKDNVLFSETEQPVSNNHILTFVDKYLSNKKGGKTPKISKLSTKNTDFSLKLHKSDKKGMASLSRIIPADISNDTKQLVLEYAHTIFKNLDCKGVIRIDFILDNDNKQLYVNEMNTIPGSLAFYLWEQKQLNFAEELDKIINIAIEENAKKNQRTLIFESHVIN